MSSHIIFDTNYLRSLGSKDYLEENIPKKLQDQIEAAIKRGDAVAIPRTVQFELNAWIKEMGDKESAAIRQAWNLLDEKGFEISPDPKESQIEIDVYRIIKKKYADIYLLEPSIDNYLDAEKRASFRLPPLPKNTDGEEFRDRIIWSQLISISKKSDLPVVIVSNDRIFENGASSDEGRDNKIINLKTEDDLNQWLDARPQPIQNLINDLLLFSNQLKDRSIELSEDDIDRISDYRSKRESDGRQLKKFILVTEEASKLPSRISGKITYHADDPVILDLKLDNNVIQVHRELTPQEEIESEIKREMQSSRRQFLENELKNMLGE